MRTQNYKRNTQRNVSSETPLESAVASASMQAVYWVQSYQDKTGEERSSWTRIGVAFTNKDGSQNLRLNFMPVGADGNIHIRPFDTEESN